MRSGTDGAGGGWEREEIKGRRFERKEKEEEKR